MSGQYEKPLTIKEAVNAIQCNDFLLPAIQRKFVWSSNQICQLFDSILRGYPINSFMMWEITDPEIKKNYKFYQFLTKYCQRFNEENPHVDVNASTKNFKAIIDGQQRLTSLYIGLCSTYAYKQPRVWWPTAYDEDVLPPRKLYIDLEKPIDNDDESMMHYNLKFLTDEQFKQVNSSAMKNWLCLHDILNMPNVDLADAILKVVLPELARRNLATNNFASETLLKLYMAVHKEQLIHYFNEKSQEVDHVLDVFIRTNSGGTKLSFSDLLMSIAVANWQGDFRKEIENLTNWLYQSQDLGFYIERDWILKTSLMLIDEDVRFKVKNFTADRVQTIQLQWDTIKACIKETFKLIRKFGINAQSLTSKNAVIPICYYLYKKGDENGDPLYLTINDLAKHNEERAKISQWFYMVLLKGIFGGQADSIISTMRRVLKANMAEPLFPLEQIIKNYEATNKDLRFDDAYIESMLNIQYGEARCRSVLHLLFPELKATENFHMDHLHPQWLFTKRNISKYDAFTIEQKEFYTNASHWNSIANLHLLNDSLNMSKNGMLLGEWIKSNQHGFVVKDLLIDETISLEFECFEEFYRARRKALKERFEKRVFMLTDQNILSLVNIREDVLDDSEIEEE
ncbi:DUF262 domain-containing protein [Acinetobacter sp. WCHAc010034]|uniref:DUF262 domain-containing protein n=1 Tax=Acinetobacter sp. WCHAc010034 TaxID=1879049 RepID=UPI00083A7857|nr:DUF262 domain-containing protein [Acinetobacter sp. WCHAc010034]AYA04286.1 DUF262 domain-containing protein [Acinetobacter sp. WCHAc010034]